MLIVGCSGYNAHKDRLKHERSESQTAEQKADLKFICCTSPLGPLLVSLSRETAQKEESNPKRLLQVLLRGFLLTEGKCELFAVILHGHFL